LLLFEENSSNKKLHTLWLSYSVGEAALWSLEQQPKAKGLVGLFSKPLLGTKKRGLRGPSGIGEPGSKGGNKIAVSSFVFFESFITTS
jgi:hypothetical protein